LTQVRGLYEDVTNGFVALTKGLNVITEELTNFIDVKVVSGNQRIGGTFVKPLGSVP
jgi:hypothetical protein